MEESPPFTILEGNITGIKFGLATRQEICTSSNSDCPISHASQLSNPFLGLPLESGKCESCGTAEPGKCEGHFGYIELPIPVYHPSHVGELKRLLSLLCLKCLKMKNRKFQVKNIGVLERALSACCEEASQVSVIEGKTTDGACYLELKVPSRSRSLDDLWNFLERYGFRYGNDHCRPLLPCEAMVILKKIPEVTRKKLAGKGYFPQDGYIMQYLPVPPNCLSVPDISDGISVMSSDLSIMMLKKVLKQVEIIKSSRSGTPNFQSHEVEANDLQIAVSQYLQVRGTAKSSRDISTRYSISKEPNDVSTKAWLEKMKTLFIRKGSGFSSRSVITGDPYKGVGEIGLPFEIAQRITFEERVNQHNVRYLQKLVDENLCLTYSDGSSTYSLREGSKGHTFLRPGQVVHRKIMDGDIVFINRPPTTHKHSLQALSVYVHEDHTVKINPLICGPLSADFDGDCVHLFYPQSLAAKAEVLELFSVEKQLLSSHSGNLNLELSTDSLLSLKIMFNNYFFSRPAAQQLALFLSNSLPEPAVLKAHKSVPFWTALQVLETCLPSSFDCCGERYVICNSKILKFDFNRDVMPSIINDIITSIFFAKGPDEVLKFFNSLQPMLMENLCSEGLSVSLEDFYIPKEIIENIQMNIQDISPLLYHLRSTYNELVELQLENHMKLVKMPITKFVLKSSSMGTLINSKSDSAIGKVVQQVGFLGLQLSDRGKIYSRALVREMASLFHMKYPFSSKYPSEEFGLVRSCLFHGLDPYQEMVHSISSREVMVRSSRGLTEPGTLFKNLMAILRDVVVCYDGTVRNVCSNSIIQFEYGVNIGSKPQSLFAAGEPVGVLAATAMSNPAYKAVLDSSANSNSSWEMMKEILLCGVKFKNDRFDRRVILYLNDCDCGRKYCRENAAYLVKNHLKKVSLKDAAVEFLIEYQRQQIDYESSEVDGGLVGHIHLNKMQLKDSNISMEEVLEKCQDTINSFCKKKKVGQRFKRTRLSFSECCSFRQSSDSKWFDMPCLKFFWQDTDHQHLEKTAHVFADSICPVLLETIIKGDPRVCSADIIWISPDTTTWIRNPLKSQKGELALDVVLEKEAVKKSGGAWRIVLDSCLPVIHLIDTMRSIPYAIKQVQDLLGISCAFEQAVQRLSTSVTMVAKGVLKEHLILLANSMTCSGNLIGFNMGGIKALSRTLNVQVPFTEATLFTPKKCFERAAEKCHMDSLSSIVASCSWGKHVAIGTGSPFDVLWDTRDVGLNQPDGIDVYSFLHMVRGSSGEVNSACLGEEIDDLDMEAADIELGQSPEHSTFDKPTFEDSVEFDFDVENQNLGSDPSKSTGWDAMQSGTGTDQPGSWTSWGKKASATDENGWAEKAADTNETNTWGKKVVEANETGGWDKKATETPETSSWGKKAAEANETGGWDKKATETTKTSSWGKKGAEANETGGWNKKATETTETSNWGKKGAEANETGGWNKRATETTETSSWAKKGEEANETGGWDKKSTETTETSTWGKKAAEATGGGDKKATETTETSNWGKKAAEATGVWDKKATEATETSSWGKKAAEANETGGSSWGKKKAAETTETSCWGKSDSQPLVNQAGTRDWSKKEESSRSTSWVAAKSGKDLNQPESYSSWGKKADETGWSKKAEQVVDTDQNMGAGTTVPRASDLLREHSGWGVVESKKVNDQSGSWGKKVEETEETSWNKKDSQSGSWGSSKMVEEAKETRWNNKDSQSGSWGSTKKVEEGDGGGWKKKEGWGSSKAGEWKNKRNNPPANKPVGGSNDGSGPTGPFTATRQRFDSFTVEEQDILSEIEPVMQSIRRIMPGYKDGDPLSAEDQAYIIDNVFNYHPDKAVKMGVGIDYVMVNKHSSFQESRCFYIVSTDGRKEDFSYRKCLENFVRGKYPDQVELFMSKYFKKPQPRPGWNRERTGGPDEAATPRSGWNRSGWNREGSGAPEEGGTPRSGWNREAGTPRSGWNREGGSEGGTPRSGWNREGVSEGGTPRSGGSGWNQDGNSALEGGTPHLGWNQEGGSAPKEAGTTPGSGWNGEDTGKEKEEKEKESRW